MMIQKNHSTTQIEGHEKGSKEINQQIKDLIKSGEEQIQVTGCQGQHNLAVGLLSKTSILLEGSVGYYCGGLIDGPNIEIHGSAGWGLGESMMSGTIRVRGNASNSCAASIRGGTVVVHGNAAARAGISMKGGLLIIEGDCGYMTGFMMQKGVIVVCGNAASALADSMYEGCIYVAGSIQELGNDAVIEELQDSDQKFIEKNLKAWKVDPNLPFKKVISGKKLWNFDKREINLWKEAL